MKLTLIALSALLVPAGAMRAQEIEIQAELMNRVGTDTSRKGDLVSARVVAPAALAGDMLDGKVNDAKSGGKLGGRSVLAVSFDTLRHGGEAIQIAAQVTSVTNSKGQANADEEGRVIQSSNGNIGKVAAATGAGALVGGLIRGGRGAAIGAGAGALASIVLIEVAADGPNVRLDPGSRINLSAKSRSGTSLASLSPIAAPAAPAVAAAASVPAAAPAARAPAAAPVAARPVSQPAAAQGTVQVSEQPNLTAVRSDFVPGEKTIFMDDFTDMAGDEPPPHWKVRGGVAELRTGGNIRQLTVKTHAMELAPNLKGLPGNFTMELELKIDGRPDNGSGTKWEFMRKDNRPTLVLDVKVQAEDTHIALYTGNPDEPERSGYVSVPRDWQKPLQAGLWVQNGRIRVYVDGARVVDVNQITVEPITSVQTQIAIGTDAADAAVGIRSVRFAESAPDFSKTIMSSGRYVTHGILFDTDSDRIKPESAAVIKMIARAFETNPNLKMLIEGHTDSTGNAAHNMDLSKRRAEAVKAVLVSQFSIDAGRLTTAGLGSTKPMDTNDTPAGRAQNRRVEFVRQ